MTEIGAIVLAGGRAKRMGGGDKLAVELGGVTLLDRVLSAVSQADPIVVVGPARSTAVAVTWTREQPAGAGPVAGIAAGLLALTEAGSHAAAGATTLPTHTVVLAGDMPLLGDVVGRLVSALGSHGGDLAMGVDDLGFDQPLLAVWKTESLASALRALELTQGAAVRSLLGDCSVTRVPVGQAALDCDVAADVELAAHLLAE